VPTNSASCERCVGHPVGPLLSLAALVLLFGTYCLVDGVFAVWTAIAGAKDQAHWWLLLLGGLVGIGIGILTFVAPAITALALLFYIALWAIVTGVLEIVAAIRLRKEIANEWLLLLSPVLCQSRLVSCLRHARGPARLGWSGSSAATQSYSVPSC
jgi:hypothetical protein